MLRQTKPALSAVASYLVLILSALLFFWLGEGFYNFLNPLVILLVLVGAVTIAALMPVKNRKLRTLLFLVILSLLFLVNYLGNLSARYAYNDCVNHGEEVRSELAKYHELTKRYPDSLDQLKGFRVPGKRILRPGMLRYESNGEHYGMSFSDNFMMQEASDVSGFTAHK